MLTLISPAKRLDLAPGENKIEPSDPKFSADAFSLCKTARRQSIKDLQSLMGISENLAKLNRDRFLSFEETPPIEATKPAALAFAGDTYLGLEAATLEQDEMAYAQSHLRILSGLYGLLRPMDRIQPYRLEMGSRLATRRGKNLYQYWGDRLAKSLNEDAANTDAKAIVNCASVEYFSAVSVKDLALPVITPIFMELKNGEPKIVSFFAKKARGAMARFMVQNRLSDPKSILDFDAGGYLYQPSLSEPDRPVFVRDPEAA